jgi:hypothetical protein
VGGGVLLASASGLGAFAPATLASTAPVDMQAMPDYLDLYES